MLSLFMFSVFILVNCLTAWLADGNLGGNQKRFTNFMGHQRSSHAGQYFLFVKVGFLMTNTMDSEHRVSKGDHCCPFFSEKVNCSSNSQSYERSQEVLVKVDCYHRLQPAFNVAINFCINVNKYFASFVSISVGPWES